MGWVCFMECYSDGWFAPGDLQGSSKCTINQVQAGNDGHLMPLYRIHSVNCATSRAGVVS